MGKHLTDSRLVFGYAVVAGKGLKYEKRHPFAG
jgi:hypothetical protein